MQEELKSISKFTRGLKGVASNYKNVSGNKMYQILRDGKILYYDENNVNKPHLALIEKGYFKVIEVDVKDKKGDVAKREVSFLTPEGQNWLHEWLVKNGYV